MTEILQFPPGFNTDEITTDGATIHVRTGGSGPAVVLLHGFGDTGDMWAPLAATRTAITRWPSRTCGEWGCRPIRKPATTRRTQAGDVARVLDRPGYKAPLW